MRIMIADDHALFREGLRYQLQDLDPELDIVEAGDFKELFHLLEAGRPVDLILVDLVMPGMPWREALRGLKERYPETPVVVIAGADETLVVNDTLKLGAAGYVPKDSSGKVMMGALRLVLSGGRYLPPSLIAAGGESALAAIGKGKHDGLGISNLTKRQAEVLSLLANGSSNKQIARDLNLSEGTVKLHISAILKTLGATNRTQAVIAAQEAGLLPRM